MNCDHQERKSLFPDQFVWSSARIQNSCHWS